MQSHHIDPLNLVRALSTALELLSSNLSFHHWRVAIIAMATAEKMPLSQQARSLLLQSALLHDIGAATSWNVRVKLRGSGASYHEEKIEGRYTLHAYNGYEFLKNSRCFRDIAKIILHHHENWQDSMYFSDIPLQSRILRLADYIEVSIKPGKHILLQAPVIINDVRSKTGTYFSPEAAEYFLAAADRESFWLNIVDISYADTFFQKSSTYSAAVSFNQDDIIDIARIFADIIDQASGFTYKHSCSVSEVSVFLAKKKGFSDDDLKDMMIAGLLHDIGKLSVPNKVLEKDGSLDDEEFALIRQHTYYTYRILQQIDGFEQIAEWAAYHHEYLDGSGYPFHLSADSLSMGARIVAAADVFVALREDRPYRKGLPADKILSILSRMAENNKLDRTLVDLLTDSYSTLSLLVKGSGTGEDPQKRHPYDR